MLFNSYEFILFFLPITVAGFAFLSRRTNSSWRVLLAFLATASLFFYGWWNPSYLLLIGGSLIFNFTVGARLQSFDRDTSNLARRCWLITGVVVNLAFIAYYKYGGFAVTIANDFLGAGWTWANVVLPLGISFFTFQQIAYLTDSAAGRVKEPSFIEYVVFVTFFPQLIAGPIVHHRDMIPQFAETKKRFSRADLQVGLTIFAIGLAKKTLLADTMDIYVSPIYATAAEGPISFVQAWIAAAGFTVQIYFDFSGYSDMALGAARMFGIILPINFNSPLKATSIIDFWTRWHITLTRFLTSYVFNPISLRATRRMARKPRPMNATPAQKAFRGFTSTLAIPVFLTMFVSGVWHGAGYQFIVWGGLHGIYLAINHLWRRVWPLLFDHKERYERFARPVGLVLTSIGVFLAMPFFRAPDAAVAWNMTRSQLGLNGLSIPEGIAVQLGPIWPMLQSLGITADATAGSQITYGTLICGALLVVALVCPNSLDMLRNYEPALGYSRDSTRTQVGRLGTLLTWQPSPTAALGIGILLALGLMSLQSVSVFLYWQF